ncbi:MAG: O-antigen ligase family protein [Candidatus Hydrogenedentes bacterium]|nr:O-antigen ligase family protein [Candidatus Hydrogenedentota bacterium]
MTETSVVVDRAKRLRVFIAAFVPVLVLAMYPYTPEPTYDIKMLLLHVGACVMAVLWAQSVFETGIVLRGPRLFFWLWAGLLAISAASAAHSPRPLYSLLELGRLVSLALIYLAASHAYRERGQIAPLALSVCGATAAASVYGFFQRAGLDAFPWDDKLRALEQYTNMPGTFGNPNVAGHTIILAVILAIYLITNKKTRLSVILLAVFVLHIGFMRHRAGLAALAAAGALMVSALLARKFVRAPRRAALTALAITGVLALVSAATVAFIAEKKSGHQAPLDSSFLLRYHSYYGAAKMIAQRPLLGFGPGAYVIENPPFWTAYEREHFARDLMYNAHVHNETLETAVDAGLPAAFMFLGLLIAGMYCGLVMGFSARNPERRRLGFLFAAFFLAYLVDGAFGFNFRSPVSGALLPLMLGALAGVWSEDKPERARVVPARTRMIAAAPVVALAALNALFGVDVFASQSQFQRANAASFYNDPEAESVYASAYRLAPWNWEILRRWGQFALTQGHPGAAISRFRAALERNPHYIPAVIGAARAQFNQEMAGAAYTSASLDAVAAPMQDIVEKFPYMADAWDVLGRTALVRTSLAGETEAARTRAIKDAEDALTKALACGASDRGGLYYLLGNARALANDLNGAEEALRRASESKTADETLWQSFYTLAERTRRFDALRRALDAAIARMQTPPEAKPEFIADAYTWLAKVREHGFQDAAGAAEALQKSCRADTRNPRWWRTYWDFAKQHKTEQEFRLFLAGESTRFAGGGQDIPDAVEAVNLAATGTPENLNKASTILARLVQARDAAGASGAADELAWVAECTADAARYLAAADDQTGHTFLNLGAVLRRAGNPALAYDMLSKALPLLNGDDAAECAIEAAETLIALERPGEALTLLRAADAQSPPRLEVRLALARALARAGKYAEARLEFTAIAEQFRLTESGRSAVQLELDKLPKN